MFCSKCGKQIDDSSGWCIHCGAQCGGAQVAKASAKKTVVLIAVIVVVVAAIFAAVLGSAFLRGGAGLFGT